MQLNTKGYITIRNNIGFQGRLAMHPRQMSLFTVLLSVRKGSSKNKHVGSPVLSLARKILGKWWPLELWALWNNQAVQSIPVTVGQPALKLPLTAQTLKRSGSHRMPGRGARILLLDRAGCGGDSSKVSLLNPLITSGPTHPSSVPSKTLP